MLALKEIIIELNADSNSDFEASSDGSKSNSCQLSNVESETDSDRKTHDTVITIIRKQHGQIDCFSSVVLSVVK